MPVSPARPVDTEAPPPGAGAAAMSVEGVPGGSPVRDASAPRGQAGPRFRSQSPTPGMLAGHHRKGRSGSLASSYSNASLGSRPKTAGAMRSRKKQLNNLMKARQSKRAPTKRLLRINVSNVRPAHAYTIVEQVKHSPTKLAHLVTNRRFARDPKSQSTDATYNTNSQTLAGKVERSSNYQRFGRDVRPPNPMMFADLEYDIDTGSKASIATSVYRAPRTYPGMRVGGSRFKVPQRLIDDHHLGPGYVDVPVDNPTKPRVRTIRLEGAGKRFRDRKDTGGADVYDPDVGPKASIARMIAESPRKFSPMSSPTPRGYGAKPRERHLEEALRNIEYNVGEQHSLAVLAEKAPNQYGRAFDPMMPRFSTDDELGRDKEVARIMRNMVPPDADGGPRASIAKSVKMSERRYSPMTSPTPRFIDPAKVLTTTPRLGPGAFDPRRNLTDPTPYAANMDQSRAKRFGRKAEAYKSNGAYYSGEREAKQWLKTGQTVGFVSGSPQRAPAENRNVMDKVYNPDTGIKASLASAVMSSPRNPYISYRSKVPRSNTVNVSSCPPALGPGSFSPVVLHHGKGSQLATEPLSPRKAPVPTSHRFAVTAKLDFTMLSAGGFPGKSTARTAGSGGKRGTGTPKGRRSPGPSKLGRSRSSKSLGRASRGKTQADATA